MPGPEREKGAFKVYGVMGTLRQTLESIASLEVAVDCSTTELSHLALVDGAPFSYVKSESEQTVKHLLLCCHGVAERCAVALKPSCDENGGLAVCLY